MKQLITKLPLNNTTPDYRRELNLASDAVTLFVVCRWIHLMAGVEFTIPIPVPATIAHINPAASIFVSDQSITTPPAVGTGLIPPYPLEKINPADSPIGGLVLVVSNTTTGNLVFFARNDTDVVINFYAG